MSSRISQPVSQVRLTNVAIVRLKRGGKRFEVACYKNKVVNWRSGVETDLDEVLQINEIFVNVSKGIIANKKELKKSFKTDDKDKIVKMILDKGELQISEKERSTHFESMFRDIATIVSKKCVNPETNRAYPVSMIERAMKDLQFAVAPSKSAKQQALVLIKTLKESGISIARAKMHLKVTVAAGEEFLDPLKEKYQMELLSCAPSQSAKGMSVMEFLIEPPGYREVDHLVRERAGQLEVVDFAVQKRSEEQLTDEVEALVIAPTAESLPDRSSAPSVPGRKKLSCGACSVEFDSSKEHREHFRCEWHRYNLKAKMLSVPQLPEPEFRMLSDEEKAAVLAKHIT